MPLCDQAAEPVPDMSVVLFTCPANADVSFDSISINADSMNGFQERIFGNPKFLRPPRYVPWLAGTYLVVSFIRFASHGSLHGCWLRRPKHRRGLERALSEEY